VGVQGSLKGLKNIMEMLRRQFMEALATIGGGSLFAENVSFALVTAPTVAPDEYLAQCEAALQACWELLNQ
jgi:hypothetical protein